MAKNIKWRILMVIGTMEGPQKLQNVRPWHVWSPPMLVFSSFIKQPIWWGTLSKNMPTEDQGILRDAHVLEWLKHKSTHLTWRQWWPKQHIHWFYHRLYRSPSSWPEKNHWRIKANCIPWESQESVAWRSHPFFPSKDTPPRVKSPPKKKARKSTTVLKEKDHQLKQDREAIGNPLVRCLKWSPVFLNLSRFQPSVHHSLGSKQKSACCHKHVHYLQLWSYALSNWTLHPTLKEIMHKTWCSSNCFEAYEA